MGFRNSLVTIFVKSNLRDDVRDLHASHAWYLRFGKCVRYVSYVDLRVTAVSQARTGDGDVSTSLEVLRLTTSPRQVSTISDYECTAHNLQTPKAFGSALVH